MVMLMAVAVALDAFPKTAATSLTTLYGGCQV